MKTCITYLLALQLIFNSTLLLMKGAEFVDFLLVFAPYLDVFGTSGRLIFLAKLFIELADSALHGKVFLKHIPCGAAY